MGFDDMRYYDTFDTPIGPLLLVADDTALIELLLPQEHQAQAAPPDALHERKKLSAVTRQLAEYFAGTRTTFDLPLHPHGTPFQLAVWQALATIPYAKTVSYAHIARQIGRPKAVRAVGAANGANPISIIVPCHRVIGSNGSLTGYGGGLPAKRWLLAHEGRNAPTPEFALDA